MAALRAAALGVGFALATALFPALLPGGAALAAGTLFCCNDPNGKPICSDILPQECYGRTYRELGASGRTLRVVEPPMTTEQRAQRAAAEEQRKAEEAIVKQQQRRDQALMNTYGSEKDIEMMRLRAQDEVQKSIKAAESRIAEIRVQRKKFENEAEFYQKRPMPPDVKNGLRVADYEISQQQSIIEAKKKESEAIEVKYAEERRRYVDLLRRSAPKR